MSGERTTGRARGDEAPDPFAQLERSHRRLEERLDALRFAAESAELASVREIQAFFGRQVARHEEDEERSLFPRVASRAADGTALASLVARLEREHREHESLHERLGRAADALEASPGDARLGDELRAVVEDLIVAYRAHVGDEEGVLFPGARELLTDEDKAEIAREMDLRRGGGGGGGGGRAR